MGIDQFSIISMSSHKNDDNNDDFDNDGEKDEQEGDKGTCQKRFSGFCR